MPAHQALKVANVSALNQILASFSASPTGATLALKDEIQQALEEFGNEVT